MIITNPANTAATDPRAKTYTCNRALASKPRAHTEMRSCARARRRERARYRAPAKARRGGGRAQVFENDMRLGRCAAGRVVCVVVDEAHKVTGKTALYMRVAHKVAGKTTPYMRVAHKVAGNTALYMRVAHKVAGKTAPYMRGRTRWPAKLHYTCVWRTR